MAQEATGDVLLDQVANSLPEDVRLQHFEPDTKQLRLRLVTESTSSSALLRHAQSLSALSSVAGELIDELAGRLSAAQTRPGDWLVERVRLLHELPARPHGSGPRGG